MSTPKFATKALHAGHDVTTTAGTRAVPIYQTSSYAFNNSDHAANLFGLAEAGFILYKIEQSNKRYSGNNAWQPLKEVLLP